MQCCSLVDHLHDHNFREPPWSSRHSCLLASLVAVQWNGGRATRMLGSNKATRNGQWLVLLDSETMKCGWCSARGGVARLEGEACDWLTLTAGGRRLRHTASSLFDRRKMLLCDCERRTIDGLSHLWNDCRRGMACALSADQYRITDNSIQQVAGIYVEVLGRAAAGRCSG